MAVAEMKAALANKTLVRSNKSGLGEKRASAKVVTMKVIWEKLAFEKVVIIASLIVAMAMN